MTRLRSDALTRGAEQARPERVSYGGDGQETYVSSMLLLCRSRLRCVPSVEEARVDPPRNGAQLLGRSRSFPPLVDEALYIACVRLRRLFFLRLRKKIRAATATKAANPPTCSTSDMAR